VVFWVHNTQSVAGLINTASFRIHAAEQLQSCESLLFQAKTSYNDSAIVKTKRLILLIALVLLVMILTGPSASVVSDTSASLTDSNIPDNELTTSQTEASNSSASATITITMYAVASE